MVCQCRTLYFTCVVTVCVWVMGSGGFIGATFADEMQDQDVGGSSWGGEGEFGFASTQGNTETQNFHVGLRMRQLFVKWENTYEFDGLNESQNKETSAERYAVNLQTNRKFTTSNFLLGTFSHEDNRFSGFDYETTASLGYGRRVIDADGLQFDVEIGPGHRTTKSKVADQSEDESILRTAAKFRYDLSETARIVQTLINTVGDNRAVTKSETALSTQVVGNLAMKVSFIVKYNSAPAEEVNRKKDTESGVTLVYKF